MKLKVLASLLSLAMLPQISHADDLLQIYQLSQDKDPVIKQAKATKDRAFEKINAAKADKLPQIGFKASANSVWADANDANGAKDDSVDFYEGKAAFGLRQSIYSQQIWQRLTITEKLATQQDAVYNLQKQILVVRVSKAYFSVLSANDNLKFTKANRRAVKRYLDQTTSKFDAGVVPITDLHEAQAAYDRSDAQVILAQNKLDNSYEDLRKITGMEHKDLNALNLEKFSPAEITDGYDVWLKQAEELNLELNANHIAMQVAEQSISLAEAYNLPTVDFTAGLGMRRRYYDDDNGNNVDLTGTVVGGMVGIELKLPVYTGGKITSNIDQAKIHYVEMSENFEKVHREIQTRLSKNLNDVKGDISSIKALEKTVKSSESALKSIQSGYRAGTRTMADVLSATTRVYNTKSKLSNVRHMYIMHMISLKQLAGTLKEQDVIDINQNLVVSK